MSSLSVNTFLSRDPSPRIADHLELFYNLVSAFQRLVPPLQILVNDSNWYKCQSLCHSIIRGAEKALIFIKLVEGVLKLKQDESRKERIYAELVGENSREKHSVDEVSDAATRYPELCDFEAELKSRLEGVETVQREIADLCQEIEEKSRDLFESDPTRNQNKRTIVAFVLGSVIFGALLIINERFFHFTEPIFAPIAWIGSFAPAFISYRHFSNAVDRERVILILLDASSQLKKICVLNDSELGAMIHETVLVLEVKVSLDKFFTSQHFERQTEKKKDELEKIIRNLKECMYK